jgi:hypothetical protein
MVSVGDFQQGHLVITRTRHFVYTALQVYKASAIVIPYSVKIDICEFILDLLR